MLDDLIEKHDGVFNVLVILCLCIFCFYFGMMTDHYINAAKQQKVCQDYLVSPHMSCDSPMRLVADNGVAICRCPAKQ